jgi:hypothetical protein
LPNMKKMKNLSYLLNDLKEPFTNSRSQIIKILAWLVLGITVFLGFNYFYLLPRSSAGPVCPLPASPEKIHGQLIVTPPTGGVIDCSNLDITVASDGELIVDRNYTSDNSRADDYGLTLKVRNLTVESQGKITASGKGYQPGEADNGNGNGGSATGLTGGSGGGYGGAGGEGITDGINAAPAPGVAYGEQTDPVLLGGAGGNTGNTDNNGGNGGGAIAIDASGTLTINGVIQADGDPGQYSTDNVSTGGGGAGGSIWINALTMAGNGLVSANGGSAPIAMYQGGGGGGGRIQMFCTQSDTFNGNVYAIGGITTNSQDGGTGSVLGPTCKPYTPTITAQLKSNGLTAIPVGGATAETSFVVAINMSDPDSGDLLFMQLEIKPVGTDFTGQPNYSQATGSANPQACSTPSSDCGKITVTGLDRSTRYHWQARVRDNKGGYSDWISFGNNNETDTDIILSGTPSMIQLLQGNNQSGVVGTNLATPFGVKIVDVAGLPVPGYTVTWTIDSGANGGLLIDGTYIDTDFSGEAYNTYKLGRQAGTGNNIVRATASGLTGNPKLFSATGTPEAIDHFSLDTPDVTLVDQDFSVTLKAYDKYNNIKTDYTGSPSFAAVDPIETSQTVGGVLTPSQVTFLLGDSGVKTFNINYDTVRSIKIRAQDDITQTGFSRTIAVVLTLGSCPDADGIIDTNQTWTATADNGGIFNCTGLHIHVMSGATLTLQGYDNGDNNYNNDLGTTILADSVTVDDLSTISADQTGFTATRGLGAGGSYGGYGYTGTPYGDYANPMALGSGGDMNGSAYTGPAGGAIKIVAGWVLVNGTISANGGDTYPTGASAYGTGSSGGSILINTDNFDGNGLIRANGGAASGGHYFGRGGSGGRIALYYNGGDFPFTSKDNVQAFGGYGPNYGYAGAGTVYIDAKNDLLPNGSLYINNNSHNGLEAAVMGAGPYRFDFISLKEYGHLRFPDTGVLVDISAGGEDATTGDGTSTLTVANLIKLPDPYNLKKININVIGNYEGASTLTIGEASSSDRASMTLYAYTQVRRDNGQYNNYGFTDLTVERTGVLSLNGYAGDSNSSGDNDLAGHNDYGVILNVSGTLDVRAGGVIEADSRGYVANTGPGAGGSYGGYGDHGTPYGDVRQPLDLGSGGSSNSSAYTGPGGGAIKITVPDLIINGTISTNGGSTYHTGASAYGTGSAGGSIWVAAGSINGTTGSIQANGGAAPGGDYFGKGGGGGRIAVYYDSGSYDLTSKDRIQAFGGYGGNAGYAGAGTIFVDGSTDNMPNGTLYINNNGHNGNNAGVMGVGPHVFDLISIKEYGHLLFADTNVVVDLSAGGEDAISADGTSNLAVNGLIILPDTFNIKKFTLNVAGDYQGATNLTIGEASGLPGRLQLYAYTTKRRSDNNYNTYDFTNFTVQSTGTVSLYSYTGDANNTGDNDPLGNNDYGVILNVSGVLETKAGGVIEADSKGYPANTGPGAGGSYGGWGNSGTPYGNLRQPTDLGSGGGVNSSAYTGPGGGAIKLIAPTFINNGTISANGGSTYPTGGSAFGSGSSGGSIWIEAGTITGTTGVIQANGGGASGGHYFGRGGSGGRIAVYYDSGSYDLTSKARVQAFGAFGPNVGYAGAGSIFVDNRTDSLVNGTLYINNNGYSGNDSGIMGVGPHVFDLISIKEYGHLRFADPNVVVDLTTGGEDAISADGTANLSVNGLIELPPTFNIKKFTLNVIGDYSGAGNLTIGEPSGLPGSMILYAYTAKRHSNSNYNTYNFNGLTVESTGTLSLYGYVGDANNTNDDDPQGNNVYGVILNATDNVVINSGGQIEADLKGYTVNTGPGLEGSYGGYGQSGNPYGDLRHPVDLGSAGGSNGCASTGAAGGAIKIVAPTLNNNGTISANGGSSYPFCGSAYGTGSSGGSIWIEASSINGISGIIRANGGDAAGGHYMGYGGSGGRIAVYYDSGTYDLTSKAHIQAFGAYGGNVGYAGAGSIFIDNRLDSLENGTLYINNNGHNGKDSGIMGVGPHVFDLISIKEYGHLRFADPNVVVDLTTGGEDAISADGTANLSVSGLIRLPATFNIKKFTLNVIGDYEGAGNLTVGEPSGVAGRLILYAYTAKRHPMARYNTYSFDNLTVEATGGISLYSYVGDPASNNDNDPTGANDYGVILDTAGTLDIKAGGFIEADTKGYPASTGAGVEGSYGGYGNSGAPYGSMYQPVDLGSGGGRNNSAYTSPGGGAIKIMADTLNIDGVISTNGGSTYPTGGSAYGTGSAGGSIWITANSLTGTSGLVRANGGDASGGHYFGRGGSGGRIAIYYNDSTFDAADRTKVQAFGGYGPNVGYAGPGTIFVEQQGENGSLYLDNNDHYGRAQDLSPINYNFKDLKIAGYAWVHFTGDTTNDRGLRLILDGNFTLGTGSILDGLGQGFPTTQGPGAGETAENLSGGGGGANGGAGGDGQSDGSMLAHGGQAYSPESQMQPLLLGSGGGRSGAGDAGGSGGGAILIDARNGALNIAGTINVNGTDGLTGSPGGGGGAGGAIYLIGDSCNITGNLYANGGNGGNDNFDGGGGGGGRIAILATSPLSNCSVSGTVLVSLGTSSEGSPGQVGTYNGIATLPEIVPDSQAKIGGEVIPVGGVTNENSVKLSADISDPGASLGNAKHLVADFEVLEASGTFPSGGVLGLSSLSSSEIQFTGGVAQNVTVTVPSGLVPGIGYKWRARVRNVTEGISSQWYDYGNNGDNADFIVSTATGFDVTLSTSTAHIGDLIGMTVRAKDGSGNTVTSYSGTITFDYSQHTNPGASLPANYTFTAQTDQGQHFFSNQLSFFSTGTYIVTATDTVDGSILGTSGQITILATTPTPTPTVSPSVTLTVTPATSVTVTPSISVSPTPASQSCEVNVQQAKCQADVKISNVTVVTDLDKRTAKVCWDTNIETIGLVKYGTDNVYSQTTALESQYIANDHCYTISSLTINVNYDYKIQAWSFADKSANYENKFVVGKLPTPDTGTPKDCIVIKPYSFNSQAQALVNFETIAPAICKVGYSNQGSDFLTGKEPETMTALIHKSTLDLSLLKYGQDIIYKIDCDLTTTDNTNIQCQAMDVIPWSKAQPYSSGNGPGGGILETLKNAGTLVPVLTLPLIGLILASNWFSFPRLSMYAIFLVRRKKRTKTWGIVYDINRHIPVAFAVIRLYDQSGFQLLKEDVSDLQGKFGFVVDRGIYKVVVEHSEYEKLETSVTVSDPEGIVAEDLGLTRKTEQTGSFTGLREKMRDRLFRINAVLVTLGFIFSVFAFIVTPEPLNGIILILYVVQELILLHSYRIPIGTVVDNATGGRLAGAFVRLYDIAEGRQLEVAMTDLKGRYRIAGKSGEYLVTAYLPGYRLQAGQDVEDHNGQLFLRVKCTNGSLTSRINMLKQNI